MNVGDQAQITKVISEEDINLFAEITLDTNPIHLDEEFAKDSIFGSKIAHGMLTGSLISAVLGTKLPGVGSIYLSQTLHFRKPVFIGDEISAIVTIVEIKQKGEKNVIECSTICKNQEEEIVLEGEAVMLK